MRNRTICFPLFMLVLTTSLCAQEGTLYTVQEGDWLSRIADRHYGSVGDWPAILLTTNANGRLSYIGDPNVVAAGREVWIPADERAREVNRLHRAYIKAVDDMALPQPWEISNEKLLVIPGSAKQCTVLTWTRSGKFRVSGNDTSYKSDTWVTIVPHLRNFCRGELKAGPDLTLRLEQRQGIPPLNGKTVFVEMVVDTDKLFRPCSDPDVFSANCQLGQPSLDDMSIGSTTTAFQSPAEYRAWFDNQYYQSHATARPSPYPWTALGYTYDWGGADEHGESEFVIPSGASFRVIAITKTDAYCAP
jgi:hypothetical protein